MTAVAALAIFVASAAAATTPPSRVVTTTACTNGVLDRVAGKTVCIHVGGKCVAAHNKKYRKRGYSCVNGRLRRYTPPQPSTPPAPPAPPAPAPAPPAPPPPPAVAGHYEGKTSQLETIQFDVTAAPTSSGLGVTGFKIQTVNRSCSPGGGVTSGLSLTGTIPIRGDGTFDVDITGTSTLSDGTPINRHFILHGSFSAATATGTFNDSLSFSYQGTAVSCTSGQATWSVSKTA